MTSRRLEPPYLHCQRPMASAPRDGTIIWIERRALTKKPIKRPVTRAKWIRRQHGHLEFWYVFNEPGCYLQDENIIGWEPM